MPPTILRARGEGRAAGGEAGADGGDAGAAAQLDSSFMARAACRGYGRLREVTQKYDTPCLRYLRMVKYGDHEARVWGVDSYLPDLRQRHVALLDVGGVPLDLGFLPCSGKGGRVHLPHDRQGPEGGRELGGCEVQDVP